jgi:AcrR family transcriptional regulator
MAEEMPERTDLIVMARDDDPGKPQSLGRMTQAERTALSDSRMYEAAIKLICEIGTHNTTLKDIGERAGYSRGLASNRFGSKDMLFANLIHNFNTRWADQLEQQLAEHSGLSSIFAALKSVEDFLIEESDYMRAMYILWYESIGSHSEVRVRLTQHHRAYRRDVAEWVQRGQEDGTIVGHIDPDQYAIQYCSFVFGTIYQWLVAPESIDVRLAFADYRQFTSWLLAPQCASAGLAKKGIRQH